MEKRLIKKDALAGIAKKMAGDFLVWAPVKKEDNVLFEPLQKDGEPFFAYLNSKNAPKNVFFPHTEAMMKFTRTPKGMVFSSEENKADSVGSVRRASLRRAQFCAAGYALRSGKI